MSHDNSELIVVSLLRRAYELAWNTSDDPETRNGAVLVDKYGSLIGESANCFPNGVKVKPDRVGRPQKYGYMVHAESGAIFAAARAGFTCKEGALFVPWAACEDCAKAIIQAGISRVVTHKQCMDRTPERWRISIARAQEMLDESGVITVRYDGTIGACEARLDSKEWLP